MLSALATLPAIASPLPAGHSRIEIAEGVKGIEQTIAQMQKLVGTAKRDINVRAAIRPIIDSCADKDYYNYARKEYEWVRDHIKYVYDPSNVEYLEAPNVLLKTMIGDCDTVVILLCSLWEQCGFKSQFVTVAADPSRPREFTHVYCRVYIPKVGWVSADPIMKNKQFGWEAEDEKVSARRYWPGSTDDLNEPLDTRPSVKSGYGNTFDGDLGISGLGALAHGGGHHHGGGRGRGFGPAWGGGWGWDGGDTYIIEQPTFIPVAMQSTTPYQMVTTDYPVAVNNNSVSFIPVAPTNPDMNAPIYNQSETLQGFGCGQCDDKSVEKVRDFITGSTLTTIKQMGQEYQKNLDAWKTCTDPETSSAVLIILRGQHDDYTAASHQYDSILNALRGETTHPIIGGTISQVLNRLDNPAGLGSAALFAAIGVGVLALINISTVNAMLDSIGQSVHAFFQKDVEVKQTLTKPKQLAGGVSSGSPWLGLAVVAGVVALGSHFWSRKSA